VGHVLDTASPRERFYCRADRVTVETSDAGKGVVHVRWTEEGRVNATGGFCQNQLDADFIPNQKRPNEYNVRFLWAGSLTFGYAKFDKNRLSIRANLTGDIFSTFEASFTFDAQAKQLTYRREIRREMGVGWRASGVLYKQAQ
jgi:hypothetical protein